jgi:hypothetical protein
VAAKAKAKGLKLPGSVALAGLPVPYARLNGTGPDGRLLWKARKKLGLDEAWFGSPGPPRTEPKDLWNPAELSYSAQLSAGGTKLEVIRHDGGDLDWFHADATGPLAQGTAAAPVRITPAGCVIPACSSPRRRSRFASTSSARISPRRARRPSHKGTPGVAEPASQAAPSLYNVSTALPVSPGRPFLTSKPCSRCR